MKGIAKYNLKQINTKLKLVCLNILVYDISLKIIEVL